MARTPRKPPPAPTETLLHDIALNHLARFGVTRAGLLRVLDRRIARWAASEAGDKDSVPEYREAARRVVAKLAESGAVNDQAYADARSRSLRRAGKSGRAIGAHLSAKGVPGEISAAMRETGEPEQREHDELGAAAIHLRRRRLGPFRTATEVAETRRKELAALARAGFAHQVAAAALRLSREEAEALIVQVRADL
jgi:regulatory protein